jgi:hypothetical protein
MNYNHPEDFGDSHTSFLLRTYYTLVTTVTDISDPQLHDKCLRNFNLITRKEELIDERIVL